jgi:SsrA-binding protein
MGAAKGKMSIAQNKKAYHDYFIDDVIECGMVLSGTEIKSVRAGKVMHISPYEQGNIYNKDPLRDRKLLLHRSQIDKLLGMIKQKGLTLVPTEIYLLNGRAKLGLAVARGKKLYDKREAMAEKEASREIDRRLKESFRE